MTTSFDRADDDVPGARIVAAVPLQKVGAACIFRDEVAHTPGLGDDDFGSLAFRRLACHLAMRGAPLKAIQELLGHATIQMTMRYAHLAPEVAREAVLLLDADVPSEVRGKTMAKTADG